MTTHDTTPVSTRPISPHLTIYKPQITTVMSILHRITGLALSFGTIFLVAWLWAAAYSPDCFTWLHGFFGSFFGKIMMFGWTVAFYYHLLNGIRHLWWDLGHGFELRSVDITGLIVAVACTALTIVTWIVAYSVKGAM